MTSNNGQDSSKQNRSSIEKLRVLNKAKDQLERLLNVAASHILATNIGQPTANIDAQWINEHGKWNDLTTKMTRIGCSPFTTQLPRRLVNADAGKRPGTVLVSQQTSSTSNPQVNTGMRKNFAKKSMIPKSDDLENNKETKFFAKKSMIPKETLDSTQAESSFSGSMGTSKLLSVEIDENKHLMREALGQRPYMEKPRAPVTPIYATFSVENWNPVNFEFIAELPEQFITKPSKQPPINRRIEGSKKTSKSWIPPVHTGLPEHADCNRSSSFTNEHTTPNDTIVQSSSTAGIAATNDSNELPPATDLLCEIVPLEVVGSLRESSTSNEPPERSISPQKLSPCKDAHLREGDALVVDEDSQTEIGSQDSHRSTVENCDYQGRNAMSEDGHSDRNDDDHDSEVTSLGESEDMGVDVDSTLVSSRTACEDDYFAEDIEEMIKLELKATQQEMDERIRLRYERIFEKSDNKCARKKITDSGDTVQKTLLRRELRGISSCAQARLGIQSLFQTLQLALVFHEASGSVVDIAFCEAERKTRVAICCATNDNPDYNTEGNLKFYDPTSSTLYHFLGHHSKSRAGVACFDTVTDAKFSPDGRVLLAADDKGQCILWDTSCGKSTGHLHGSDNCRDIINRVAVRATPISTHYQFASCLSSGNVNLFDVTPKRNSYSLQRRTSYDEKDNRVASDILFGRHRCADTIIVGYNGKGNKGGGVVRVWNIERRKVMKQFAKAQRSVSCIAVARSGSFGVCGTSGANAKEVGDGRIWLYDLPDSDPIASAATTEKDATLVSISPNESYVAVGGANNIVEVYDTRFFDRVLATLPHVKSSIDGGDGIEAIQWPSGHMILSGGEDGVRIWDLAKSGSEMLVKSFECFDGNVGAVALSENMDFMCVGSSTGSVYVFTVDEEKAMKMRERFSIISR
ncbi:4714_t:CDS:2 [Paraglomus occultum]|uniref:4714_t:CDS:1 n=1 Tax=Paraglomus occultum TaxID=144539 RepID=A0A9N8VU78_9GLOM|nr:4714_t:CDS:2 [Paraglomus occultum]